jgi:chromosome segregation ATPase
MCPGDQQASKSPSESLTVTLSEAKIQSHTDRKSTAMANARISDDLDRHASGILLKVQAILVDLMEAIEQPIEQIAAIQAITRLWPSVSLQERLNKDLTLSLKHLEAAFLSLHDDYILREKYNELEVQLRQLNASDGEEAITLLEGDSHTMSVDLEQKLNNVDKQIPASDSNSGQFAARTSNIQQKAADFEVALASEKNNSTLLKNEIAQLQNDAQATQQKVTTLEEELFQQQDIRNTLEKEKEVLVRMAEEAKQETADLKRTLKDAKKMAKEAMKHFQTTINDSSDSEAEAVHRETARKDSVIDMTMIDKAHDTPVKLIELDETALHQLPAPPRRSSMLIAPGKVLPETESQDDDMFIETLEPRIVDERRQLRERKPQADFTHNADGTLSIHRGGRKLMHQIMQHSRPESVP